MQVTLVAATTVDGKITKWENPNVNDWNSPEDKKHFASVIDQNNLIIMGSETYLSIKSSLKSSTDKLRVVLTSKPENFRSEGFENQLEFSSDSPGELLEKLGNRGYKKALLVGGEKVHQSFLKEKLVNQIWLTLEPKIFGAGKGLAGNDCLDVSLKLIGFEKLSENGTLLLKYEVL